MELKKKKKAFGKENSEIKIEKNNYLYILFTFRMGFFIINWVLKSSS